jgi:hypothetical protein
MFQLKTPKGKEKGERTDVFLRKGKKRARKRKHTTLTSTLFAFYTFYIYHLIKTVKSQPQDFTDKRKKPDCA